MKLLRIMKSLTSRPVKKAPKPSVVIPEDVEYERVEYNSFSEMIAYVENVQTPDEARHIIHYLFQGMYDLLGSVSDPHLHELYKRIINAGIKYYKSFYTGDANINIVKNLLPYLAILPEYDNKYYYKIRGNFDHGSSIGQSDIGNFLQGAIDSDFKPDVVVGIATSASEPAMALAGILDIPLEFVRYSKRRGDGSVTVLDFMAEEVNTEVVTKNVLVIDDWVASGNSMKRCMRYISGLGASQVRGATIEDNGNDMDIKTIERKPNFKLYA